MENAMTIPVSPLQAFLSVAFQAWIIIFPIIIIKKLNRLTALFEEEAEEGPADS